MLRRTAKLAISCALTAGLVLSGTPCVAFAVTSAELQAQLDDAQAHLGELYEKAEQASEELNDTRYQIDETNKRIDENVKVAEQKQQELDEASALLSDVVAEDYKRGSMSLLSLVLGSSSVEEIVSNIYVANKVSVRQQEVIDTVKTVRAELDEARTSLEKDRSQLEVLAKQQEERQESLQASADETQQYVNGLSAEVQEALAREEEERRLAAEREAREQAERLAAQAAAEREAAERAAAEQEEARQQEQQQQSQNTSTTSNTNTNTNTNSGSTSSRSSSSSSGGSVSSGAASTIVSAALSQVGVSYVWGTSNPGVSFDCSGLVMYCYGCAGISVPHSSGALSAYCGKPASSAVAGDIVWRPGHVGICIGGGQTVEAFSPGQGVGFGSVSDFVSAGSPA